MKKLINYLSIKIIKFKATIKTKKSWKEFDRLQQNKFGILKNK